VQENPNHWACPMRIWEAKSPSQNP